MSATLGLLVRTRRGQNTLEYAIGLNILFLLTIGVVDLGRGVWAYNTLAHLAREGARYGSAPSRTSDQIVAYVVSRAVLPGFSASNVSVVRGKCGVESQPVVVTTTYRFESITPFISRAWGGGPLDMRAESRMYVERGLATDPGCL